VLVSGPNVALERHQISDIRQGSSCSHRLGVRFDVSNSRSREDLASGVAIRSTVEEVLQGAVEPEYNAGLHDLSVGPLASIVLRRTRSAFSATLRARIAWGVSMRFANTERLRRISEGTARDYGLWTEGVFLQTDTGHTLDELRDRATSDRLALAAACATRAAAMLTVRRPMYRDVVSRSYYAMYHAWRAVAFHVHGGDDHQEHKKLPDFEPTGFGNSALWQNRLKEAREARNRADYEPYPKAETAWRQEAQLRHAHAVELIRLCRAYLRIRGCRYL
jgi:uncharacterized protein (UPF0332 family)